MSSDTSRTYRRPHLGRMRRAALTAVAVVVGAIVLSGCVVIQSESAVQANVIGNSVTVTTVLCREQRVRRCAVQQPGEPEPERRARCDRPAARRLPDTRRRDGSTDDRVERPLGATRTAARSRCRSRSRRARTYSAGLDLAPAASGPAPCWVGYESETQNYTPTGPQTLTLAPSFGLPAGFAARSTGAPSSASGTSRSSHRTARRRARRRSRACRTRARP